MGSTLEHPTGAADVVLRMETGGGLLPLESLATHAPDFTLYGDGTFIVRPDRSEPLDRGEALEPHLQGRLDEEAVQRLLAFALGRGRLAGAREHYEQNSCADCPSTTFTIRAGGVDKRVGVDGLGIVEQPDPVDRAGFQQLAEVLRGFEDRARKGEVGQIVAYDPELYRVTLLEVHGEPLEEPAPWPWPDVPPSRFEPGAESGLRQIAIGRDEVALITQVPSGGHPGLIVEHDGTRWRLAIRPLLPDELALGAGG